MWSLNTYVHAGGPLLTLYYQPRKFFGDAKPPKKMPRPRMLALGVAFALRNWRNEK